MYFSRDPEGLRESLCVCLPEMLDWPSDRTHELSKQRPTQRVLIVLAGLRASSKQRCCSGASWCVSWCFLGWCEDMYCKEMYTYESAPCTKERQPWSLRHWPSGFLTSESLEPIPASSPCATHQLVLLYRSGYATMRSVSSPRTCMQCCSATRNTEAAWISRSCRGTLGMSTSHKPWSNVDSWPRKQQLSFGLLNLCIWRYGGLKYNQESTLHGSCHILHHWNPSAKTYRDLGTTDSFFSVSIHLLRLVIPWRALKRAMAKSQQMAGCRL